MRKSETSDVTGRDGYIVCKALTYAIETIEALPKKWQEWSDKEDMITLLEAISPNADERAMMRTAVRSHMQQCGMTVINGQLQIADRPSVEG
jgi:hypothetical protein